MDVQKKGRDFHADATQDKAWAIDLYLVKHSGWAERRCWWGTKKVDWWAGHILAFISFSLPLLSSDRREHFGYIRLLSSCQSGLKRGRRVEVADSERVEMSVIL